MGAAPGATGRCLQAVLCVLPGRVLLALDGGARVLLNTLQHPRRPTPEDDPARGGV